MTVDGRKASFRAALAWVVRGNEKMCVCLPENPPGRLGIPAWPLTRVIPKRRAGSGCGFLGPGHRGEGGLPSRGPLAPASFLPPRAASTPVPATPFLHGSGCPAPQDSPAAYPSFSSPATPPGPPRPRALPRVGGSCRCRTSRRWA